MYSVSIMVNNKLTCIDKIRKVIPEYGLLQFDAAIIISYQYEHFLCLNHIMYGGKATLASHWNPVLQFCLGAVNWFRYL